VAAELRNEIRPDPSQGLVPTWGDGNPRTDWRAAAERGGDTVLKANPRLLIIVGGTDYQGHLRYVPDAPVRLAIPHKLVYAVHDYPWNHSITELQGDDAAFRANLDARWGLVTEPGHPWTAPVLLSEFGGCTQPRDDGSLCTEDRLLYPHAITRYLRATDMDWVWWPLNGTQSAGYNRVRGAVETWGLLNPQWSAYANPDLMAELRSLIHPIVRPSA
jgi:endoglucanase